jgi:hypothetical protein
MISIFAHPVRKFPSGHYAPFSSVIRGNQVVDYLGARLNPGEEYEDDTCIFVKRCPDDLLRHRRVPYVDIVDGWALCPTLRNQSRLPVIACSSLDYVTLVNHLPNKVVLIPQQNCNFERRKRIRKDITCVGVIGTSSAWKYLPQDLEGTLDRRSLNFWKYSEFRYRQDVVEFYLSIDIQIVWRPYLRHLSNPLKIVNAMSFGIPTIAFYERCFDELEGCYIPVTTVEEFFYQLDMLRNSSQMYEDYVQKGLEKAEEYHISKIAKLYEALDGC